MQKHLNILGYKTTIPDSNRALMAVSNDGDILMFTKEKSLSGFSIWTLYPFKNNVKKDIKFYKFLEKINEIDLIKVRKADNYLVISMDSLNKYNREDFTQIVNKFNELTTRALINNKKEILEYLK